MSESKHEPPDQAQEATPQPAAPAAPGETRKVDEGAQKDAAQERATEGGYD